MHRPVRFADDIEPLVQFIEETDPSRILEATLGKLREASAISYGKNMEIYEEALELLHA